MREKEEINDKSTNLHANDEAVLIICRVSVRRRDTIPSRKQKGGKKDGKGDLMGESKRSSRSIS